MQGASSAGQDERPSAMLAPTLPTHMSSSPVRLATRFTQQFGCRVPILGAPMAGVSGGKLAAATHHGGGLGFIAAGHFSAPESLREQVAIFRAEAGPDAPLGIGFIGFSSCSDGVSRIAVALAEHKPQAVQFFAPAVIGDDGANIAAARAAGALVVAQVGSEAAAREALTHNVDCIVAQGREAGGHGLRSELATSTLPLATRLLQLVHECAAEPTKVSVLAAGGIVDGRGLAAALALGCDGVVFGTRLWASEEAMGRDGHKAALVAANGDDVVRTSVFDHIMNSYSPKPWPQPFDSVGALHNLTSREWHGRLEELGAALASGDGAVANRYREAVEAGDTSKAMVLSGEGVGCIQSVEAAADVIRKAEADAIAQIRQIGALLVEVGDGGARN